MKSYLLFGSIILSLVSVAQYPPDLSDPTWQLIWSDEFNDGTISTALWEVKNEFDHGGGHNVVFNNGNVVETNGNLVLTLKEETYYCTSLVNCKRQDLTGLPYDYTGGYVTSKASYNFKYGYIEARIKFDYGHAMWPAFWTFRGDGVTSSNADEIDICEMLMWDESDLASPWDSMTSNLHYTYNGQDPSDGFKRTAIGNYDDVYRTFSIEWNPDSLIWYVDGVIKRVYPNPGIVDPVKVLFDIGIREDKIDGTTPSQKDMLVDYIRVYQKNGDCGSSPTYCIFNFNGWTEAVKHDITIGCPGYSNTQPDNTTQFFWVTNSFTINGEFTVPYGSSMIVQIEDECY